MTLTLPPLQDFSSEETDFYFYQFLSNFFKYFFLKFLLSHLYNIFTIYLSDNFPLLKSLFSANSNFSCCLTSIFILFSNSTTTSFAFSKSFSLFQVLCSVINFDHTKYFTTSLTFLLFIIFLTFHSFTSSTSTSFTFFIFCLPTCFLYCTT